MQLKLIALTLSIVIIAGCTPRHQPAEQTVQTVSQTDSPQSATPEQPAEENPMLPYSTKGFKTVDAEGNRVTTGRDATGDTGMAVSSKYEVSRVGAEILAKGGNAVDAAVAMGFAISVCEPFSNGMGGGGFAAIRTAGGESVVVDFREAAPAKSYPEMFLKPSCIVPEIIPGVMTLGGLASGIPGDVAGLLYMLENYGTMSRGEVLAPAIRIAAEGFLVTEYCADAIAGNYDKAIDFPEMQRVYWGEDGKPYQEGDVIANPGMAKALGLIAEHGYDGFYKGEVAEAIVESVNKYEGIFTLEDLAGYQPVVHKPVSGTYRGYEILSAPSPSTGGTSLVAILNILENFDVASMQVNSAEYIHLLTEIYKLIHADRARYMTGVVPPAVITSKEYAAERAGLIDMERAEPNAMPGAPMADGTPRWNGSPNTTHISVADADGSMVAMTKTINYYFGSGVMVDGYGFMMNNSMEAFAGIPMGQNEAGPGKKPPSSMSPTIVLKNGDPYMILGTPGGARIFATIAQTLSRVIDHGMDIHDAISVARIWNVGNRDQITYELPLKGYEQYAVTAETIAALVAMGHGLPEADASGSVQAIVYKPDGTLYGTADPRQDGKAVGN